MRVVSMNLNGIRSATEKGWFEWLRRQDVDVACVQETRAQLDQLPRKARMRGWWSGHAVAEKRGYSGVAIYARREPDRVETTLGWPDLDREGRWIRADFGPLSVVSFYLPSGSSSEARQARKLEVLARLGPFLEARVAEGRELLIAGDWNIAHTKDDLKNWRSNQKNSGFLPEERAFMDRVFGPIGLVDAFRVVNKRTDEYTWWSNRGQAWANNVGWRIDYHVVTPGLAKTVRDAWVYKRKRFADHAPVVIDYDFALPGRALAEPPARAKVRASAIRGEAPRAAL